MNYEPGMLLSFKWDSDSFGICKVIKVTETRRQPIISVVTYSNTFKEIPENLDLNQLKPMVLHMPILSPGLEMSECKPIGSAEITPNETSAYENWAAAWQDRRAGFFEKSIDDSVNHIMEAMAEVDTGQSNSPERQRLAQQWQSKMPRL